MSIVRVGLAETNRFAEGYEAIFGNKKVASAKKSANRKRPTPLKKTSRTKRAKAKKK